MASLIRVYIDKSVNDSIILDLPTKRISQSAIAQVFPGDYAVGINGHELRGTSSKEAQNLISKSNIPEHGLKEVLILKRGCNEEYLHPRTKVHTFVQN